jgi:hypothetical protein
VWVWPGGGGGREWGPAAGSTVLSANPAWIRARRFVVLCVCGKGGGAGNDRHRFVILDDSDCNYRVQMCGVGGHVGWVGWGGDRQECVILAVRQNSAL